MIHKISEKNARKWLEQSSARHKGRDHSELSNTLTLEDIIQQFVTRTQSVSLTQNSSSALTKQ